MELKEYVGNADKEIRKREQREVMLMEDNEDMRRVIEGLRKEV